MKVALISILISLSISVYSQTEIGIKPMHSGNDTVNFQNIDQLAMNNLLMNDIGKAKGTSKLTYDSLLFKAAEFHALYLNELEALSHTEATFPLGSTVDKRIRFFIPPFSSTELKNGKKGNNLEISEICCFFTIRKDVSYQELSTKIIEVFKASSVHWSIIVKNMGDKKFVNAASVISRPAKDGGYVITVVILPNYYNENYNIDPNSTLNVISEIKKGKWNKIKRTDLYTKKEYFSFIDEYNKRKRLVN